MKIKILFVTTLALFAISSCGKESNTDSIFVNNNLDVETMSKIELTSDELLLKLNSNQSFGVFMGLANCTICENAKQKVIAKVKEKEIELFSYTVESLPDEMFGKLNVNTAPSFLIIKNGIKVYSLNAEQINNEHTLKTTFDNYFKLNSTYTLSKVDTLSEFEEYNDFIALTYYKNDKYVYPYLTALNKKSSTTHNKILLIDNSILENKEATYKKLCIDKYDSEYLCFVIKDKNIYENKVVKYLSDKESFDTLIANYFQ